MAGVIWVKIHDDETRIASVNDKMLIVFMFVGEIAEDTAFMFGSFDV